jgi:F0F1-type ATP synthase membrane subunit c/vacuolar-type H+-ATPase subunit K
MDSMTLIALASIIMAGLTTGFGTMGPALAEGRAVATALTSLAQQPDAAATITRTLFVGLAMIEPERFPPVAKFRLVWMDQRLFPALIPPFNRPSWIISRRTERFPPACG